MNVVLFWLALPEVVDTTDMHTDFGQGRFIPSMPGDIIFSTFYLSWFSI